MRSVLIDDDWNLLCSFVPLDLDESAVKKLAIRRFRHLYSGKDLLRICLMYGFCDASLRQTATWASAKGLGAFSNVAILKRLRNCDEWLSEIIGAILSRRRITAPRGVKISILDATYMKLRGSNGSDYCLHMNMDLNDGRIREFRISDIHDGETLRKYAVERGRIYIADRGYASGVGISHIIRRGGEVVIRHHQTRLRLCNKNGGELNLPELLSTLSLGEIGDWDLRYKESEGNKPIRLVAIKRTKESMEAEVRRQEDKARKNCRKMSGKSFEMSKYMCILTSLKREKWEAEKVLELYKYRWQIELLFKRLKSLMRLDNTRAQSDKLCRVYYLSKMLGALLVEEMNEYGEFFSPWGYEI